MNRNLNKLCLACNYKYTGANWAKHIETNKHLNAVKALGGINPGFELVRDLDQESVLTKKTDRHLS